MANKESFLNMLPTGIREPLRKLFDSDAQINNRILLDASLVDGITISGAMSDNAIEISGNCTGAAICITGTNGYGIEMTGTHTTDILLSSGATIHNTNANTLTITEATIALVASTAVTISNALTVTGLATFNGAVAIQADDKVTFRSANQYIQSVAAGHIKVAAATRVTISALQCYVTAVLTPDSIEVVANGNIRMELGSGKMQFQGDQYWATHYIWSQAVGHIEVVAPTRVTITSGQIYLTGTVTLSEDLAIGAHKLTFQNVESDTHYIWSQAAGHIQILCPTRVSISASQFYINGYFQLKMTDTDGTEDGQIWWDASEHKIKYYNGSAVKTIAEA